MSGFTKLHNCILDSTIWRESDTTRILWITMLAMADLHGAVESSLPGLADRARLSIEQTKAGLAVLLAPDEFSRTKDDDGRRISEIAGGWLVTNHGKYRDRSDPEARREYLRAAKAKTRQTEGGSVVVAVAKSRSNYVYYVSLGELILIGSGKNPWARVSELPAGATLIGCEIAGAGEVVAIRKKFSGIHVRDDWFSDCEALREHLRRLPSLSSTQAEADTEADQKGTSFQEVPVASQAGHDPSPDSGIEPEELASYLRERNETIPFNLEVEADGFKPGFPWVGVEAAMKRIVPEIAIPPKADRRNGAMTSFWRKRGKTVGSFEVLARKVQASDYLMARNGFEGSNGRPFPWSWIFSKDKNGKFRCDTIVDDDAYSNERMKFIPDKQAKAAAAGPKLTRVVLGSPTCPVEVDLAEKWQGKARYRVVGTHPIGLPDVLDDKVA